MTDTKTEKTTETTEEAKVTERPLINTAIEVEPTTKTTVTKTTETEEDDQ